MPSLAAVGRDVRERPGGVKAPRGGQTRAMEWMTLVSAGVGAIIATASAAVLEHGRWRRETASRCHDLGRARWPFPGPRKEHTSSCR